MWTLTGRTYRERKDRYTKALEQELAVSRAREAHLMQENARLKETIQSLKQGHGFASTRPAGAASDAGSSSFNGIAGLDGIDISSDELAAFDFDLDDAANLNWPDFATVSNSLCSTPQIRQVNEALSASLSPTSSGSVTSPPCCIGDVDPTDIGMQFILKLEEPCIGHMHVPAKAHEETNVSNNHSLTVTSRLADMGFTDGSSTTQNMQKEGKETRLIMQSMLALSKDLVLPHSGSLTPVQAWQSVCAQPQFASLPVKTVQALGESLRDLVKCHGFGAVIEQSVFAEQVSRALASSSRGYWRR